MSVTLTLVNLHSGQNEVVQVNERGVIEVPHGWYGWRGGPLPKAAILLNETLELIGCDVITAASVTEKDSAEDLAFANALE